MHCFHAVGHPIIGCAACHGAAPIVVNAPSFMLYFCGGAAHASGMLLQEAQKLMERVSVAAAGKSVDPHDCAYTDSPWVNTETPSLSSPIRSVPGQTPLGWRLQDAQNQVCSGLWVSKLLDFYSVESLVFSGALHMEENTKSSSPSLLSRLQQEEQESLSLEEFAEISLHACLRSKPVTSD